MLIVLSDGLRYIGNSPSDHRLTDRKIDTSFALRVYLQDHQTHEELAFRLQSATGSEIIHACEQETQRGVIEGGQKEGL
jgi:hypothetical protein